MNSASCETCHHSFVMQRRSARFCSVACRVAAHRARSPVTHAASRGAAGRELKPAAGRSGAPQSLGHAAGDTRVTLRAVGIVPDERWPGMWRIKFVDGRLSDMINLTRAKDCGKVQRRSASKNGSTRRPAARESSPRA